MKKNKILCFLICCVLVFCVFAGCEQAEESKQDISNAENSKNVSEISEEVSEEEPFVIIDKRDERWGWSEAQDKFFEDAQWIYFFTDTPMSEYVIVEYSDGTSQNVKEAFADGNITIADLDRFGIEYMKKPNDASN